MNKYKATWLIILGCLATLIAGLQEYKTVEVQQSIGKMGVYKLVQQYWTIDTMSQTITLTAYTAGSPAPGGSWKFGQDVMSCHNEEEPIVGSVHGCAYMKDLPDFTTTSVQYIDIDAGCYTSSTQTGVTYMGAWKGSLPNYNLIFSLSAELEKSALLNDVLKITDDPITVSSVSLLNGRGTGVDFDFSKEKAEIAFSCTTSSSKTFLGDYVPYNGKPVAIKLPENLPGSAQCSVVAKGFKGCFSSDLSCSAIASESYLAVRPGVSDVKLVNSTQLHNGTINATIAPGNSLSITPTASYMGTAYSGNLTLEVNCPGFTTYYLDGAFSQTFIIDPPNVVGLAPTNCTAILNYVTDGNLHTYSSQPFQFVSDPVNLDIEYPQALQISQGKSFYVIPTLYSRSGQQISSDVKVDLVCNNDVVDSVQSSIFNITYLTAPISLAIGDSCSIQASIVTTMVDLPASVTSFVGESNLIVDPLFDDYPSNGVYSTIEIDCGSQCAPRASASPSAPSAQKHIKGASVAPITFFQVIDPVKYVYKGGSFPVAFVWGGPKFTTKDFVDISIASDCSGFTSTDSFKGVGSNGNFTIYNSKLKLANGACTITYSVTANTINVGIYTSNIFYIDSIEASPSIEYFTFNDVQYAMVINSEAKDLYINSLSSPVTGQLYFLDVNGLGVKYPYGPNPFNQKTPSAGYMDADQHMTTQFVFVAPAFDVYTFNAVAVDDGNFYYGLACNGTDTGDWKESLGAGYTENTHSNNTQQFTLAAGQAINCHWFSYGGTKGFSYNTDQQCYLSVVNSAKQNMDGQIYGYSGYSVITKLPITNSQFISLSGISSFNGNEIMSDYPLSSISGGAQTSFIDFSTAPSFTVKMSTPTIIQAPATPATPAPAAKNTTSTKVTKDVKPAEKKAVKSVKTEDAVSFAATSAAPSIETAANYQLLTRSFTDSPRPFSQVVIPMITKDNIAVATLQNVKYSCVNGSTTSTGSFSVETNALTYIPITPGDKPMDCTVHYGNLSSKFTIEPYAPFELESFELAWSSASESDGKHEYYQSLQVIPFALGHTKFYPHSSNNITSKDGVSISFSVSPSDVFSKPLKPVSGGLLQVFNIEDAEVVKNGTLNATATLLYRGKKYTTSAPTLKIIPKPVPASATHSVAPPVIHAHVKPEDVHLLFGILPMWWIAVFVILGLLVLICIGGCFTKCYHIKDRIRKRRMRKNENIDNDEDEVILETDPAIEDCDAVGADSLDGQSTIA